MSLYVAVPSGTGQANRAKTSVRRREILETATAVFADKGIIATTVRDISERAGILSGSLYHHFASKEEMIAEILSPVITSQVDIFERITANVDDPTEILRQGIAAAIAQTAANPGVARILHQDEHHIRELPGLDEVVRLRRAIRARLEGVIEQGITVGQFRSDCNARVMSTAYFDLVLGAYRHLEPIGRHSAAEVTEQLTALVLQGLRTV
jgi:TetR/AcrR family transcriptional regulator, cholesterol catabolism regulator